MHSLNTRLQGLLTRAACTGRSTLVKNFALIWVGRDDAQRQRLPRRDFGTSVMIEDGRKGQVHQQVQQPKLDANPEPWFAQLLEGATAERLRLEVRIRNLQRSLRSLEFVALLLSVAAATT